MSSKSSLSNLKEIFGCGDVYNLNIYVVGAQYDICNDFELVVAGPMRCT